MSELPERLPAHLAIIMDGNGRWAARRGVPRSQGHRAGGEAAARVAELCADWGMRTLTLYAFSTENWRRPRAEVRFLMGELERFLKTRRDEFLEHNIRLRHIGTVEDLPGAVQRELRRTIEATADCTALDLVVALNYGAHREIADAARRIALAVQAGELTPDEISEQTVEDHLYTAGLPPLDLLVRSAGEMRLSNFLLWQAYYAELYVTDTLWPDFGRDDLLAALRAYAERKRRFGRRPADEQDVP